jgi:site-specific recombinase XerD
MKLADAVHAYVDWKRSLGFRFRTTGNVLKAFAREAGPIGVHDVTQQIVESFLNGPQPRITSSWHTKHYALAGLFRFGLQRGLLSTSPLPHFVPKRPEYARPYIYSAEELQRILDGSKILDARNRRSGQAASIPPLAFRTLVLMLYGAGLRLSEALALTTDDVDLSAGLLVVRNTKFFKTRLLPIGPKLCSALRLYEENRLTLLSRPPSVSSFLLRRHGIAISHQAAERCFRMVRSHVGMRREDGAYFQPRLHDLRHSFAVHRLVAWYRQGEDVQRLLPKLSTYLGHIGLAETQHYLTMTPDLLREAGRRFETYVRPETGHDQ